MLMGSNDRYPNIRIPKLRIAFVIITHLKTIGESRCILIAWIIGLGGVRLLGILLGRHTFL